MAIVIVIVMVMVFGKAIIMAIVLTIYLVSTWLLARLLPWLFSCLLV
jgi:hypothetical protein